MIKLRPPAYIISREVIARAVNQIAQAIARDHNGAREELHFIGVMDGGFAFLAPDVAIFLPSSQGSEPFVP